MAGEAGTMGVPPAHYAGNGTITPFQVWDTYRMDPYTANAFKYLVRWDKKDDPLGDLRKAAHYLQEAYNRFDGAGYPYSHPALAIPSEMLGYHVTRAFGITEGGDVEQAVFYLLEGCASSYAPTDLLRSMIYVERAIRALEDGRAS